MRQTRSRRKGDDVLQQLNCYQCRSATIAESDPHGLRHSQKTSSSCLSHLVFGRHRLRAARAAWHDDFEGTTFGWQAGEADVDYQVQAHQLIHNDAHTGRSSELIQIAGSMGSYVYFAHELPPARVVAELVPTVWIKANRPGMQLLARVVLPHTPDPRTGRPVAALIRGSSYSAVGSWQQLRIDDVPLLVSRQVRVLRAQIGPQVDPREAYIDQVLLNVFGGPGQSVVETDDLEIAGLVPRQAAVQTVAATSPIENAAGLSAGSTALAAPLAGSAPGGEPEVSINGSLLMVNRRPMFPRIIQWQGEPLAWLKEHGFNVVHSTGELTPEMLAEAQRLGIWLIGPPPSTGWKANDSSSPLGEITAAYQPVLAWHLGNNLAGRELPATTALVKQLHTADRQLRRPIVGGVEEEALAYSRQLDALSVFRNPLGTSLDLRDYGAWLREQPRLSRIGTPLWAVAQTELAPEVLAQAAALGGPQASEPAIDADALRLLVYESVAAGMRAIEFASSSRLDASDSPTRIRALSMSLLNLELELIEPWAAAGNWSSTATSTDTNVRGVVLVDNLDSAQLVLAIRNPQNSQFLAAPQEAGTALVVPGVSETQSAYELTVAGLRKLQSKRVAGGMSIALDDFLLTSTVLITSNPTVITAMTARTKELAPRGATRARACRREVCPSRCRR